MFKRIFILFIFLSPASSFAQKGALSLSVWRDYNYSWDTVEHAYRTLLFFNNDTVYNQWHGENNSHVDIGNLPVGIYTLSVQDTFQPRTHVTREVEIIAGKEITVNVRLNGHDYTDDYVYRNCDSIRETEPLREHFVGEIDYFYGNSLGFEEGNPVKSEYGAAMGFGWSYAFLNRVSIGYKTGLSYSHAYFKSDSVSFTAKKIEYQRYSYLTMPFKVNLLFTTGNQNKEGKWQGLLIETGVVYNLPILCREVMRYNNQKIIAQNLHQFTDVRIYAGIGGYPVQAYAEYRLFDFLRGAYPEMPKIRFGLKIMIGD